MAGLVFYNGCLLMSSGCLAGSTACCCGGPCCGKTLPTDADGIPNAAPRHDSTLYAHFSSPDGTCTCINGMCVALVWSPANQWWQGTGPGGGACALLAETFRLICGEFDRTDCLSFKFSLETGVSCIQNDGFQPLAGCDCKPTLDYRINLSGIGCCDNDPGNIKVIVDTVPC